MKPYYQDGNIAIFHGDSREYISSLSYGALVTDPPYGISLASNGTHFSARSVLGDESQAAGALIIEDARKKLLPIMAFADPNFPWPGRWTQGLVWNKGEAVGSGGDPHRCWRFDWELIQVVNMPPLLGGRNSSVLNYPVRPFAPEYDFRFHPCQKPVALMSYLLSKLDLGSGIVLDAFMGSGSTLIAAKRLGMPAIGIELEEKYCEIAASRLTQGVLFV